MRHNSQVTLTDTRDWPQLAASLDDHGPVPVGLLLLATDRASGSDITAFLPDGVEAYATRIPMDVVATPETLARLGDHLTEGARLLAPGGPLAAIGFSCTSGTVAVGAERARAQIAAGRPGVPVCTPVEAAVKALDALGTRRIALLTPYLDGPSELIAGFFAAAGIDVVTRASFKLDGDPEMNRVSQQTLIDAGRELGAHPDADALFISCTGLRTQHVIEPLEQLLGKPVVTSNQALAWDLARTAGVAERLPGRGRLFAAA
jgi:maleate isomerase